MRICQVLASWGHGGLEKHVVELGNALCEEHEVAVIAHPEMQSRFDPRITFIPVDFSRGRWSPGLHRDLLAALKSWPADIVHAQANKAASLVGRLRPLVKAGGFVATLHNQKGSTGMFRHFDHVIAVSPGIAVLIKSRPVTAIYNGIRAPQPVENGRALLAAEFGFDAGRPILIGVGRLVEAKAFDILVPAAAQAKAQVLIVGDGPMKPELEAAIAKTGAEVRLAGFRTDAQRLMAAADGFVLSSRNEGFAYVFVEAILAKRPIVATTIPMVAGFVPEDLLAPVEDVAALAERLAWAVAHPDDWRQKMQPYFDKADNELTLQAMVRKTVAVYQNLESKH